MQNNLYVLEMQCYWFDFNFLTYQIIKTGTNKVAYSKRRYNWWTIFICIRTSNLLYHSDFSRQKYYGCPQNAKWLGAIIFFCNIAIGILNFSLLLLVQLSLLICFDFFLSVLCLFFFLLYLSFYSNRSSNDRDSDKISLSLSLYSWRR